MSGTPSLAAPGWTRPLWECWSPVTTCLFGYCCPCFLHGKTQSRLEDPTLSNYKPVNEHCLTWCGLGICGLFWIIQAKKRNEMREKLGISDVHLEGWLKMEPGHIKAKHGVEGALVEDCLASFCCPLCGLVQEEKESLIRLENGTGYQKSQGMSYGQPS